jgi:SAM-dependent methyltransferase
MSTRRPSWQLPVGVTRGTWDYIQSDHIAHDYDDYFAYNSLFEFDEQVLARHFPRPGLVIDLGCGTGRALVPLARRGFRGLAVDLSAEMLAVVGDKAAEENLPIERLRANLVELDCLADASVDYAISLFSTVGMIQGRANRQRALAHVRRVMKPGGVFVLHVHNFWYNLYDPGGPWWVLRSLLRAAIRRDIEVGDKFFDYRRIPNMFLHVFRRGELTAALAKAGFRIREMIPLDPRRHAALRWPWLLSNLRANGWVVVCE